MKLLTRAQFLELPAGVIYCQGKPIYFGGPAVKGDTVRESRDGEGEGVDWWSRNLEMWDFDSTEQMSADFDKMLTGATYPLNASETRDGCFEADELFLVYEPADLDALQAVIDAARKVSA